MTMLQRLFTACKCIYTTLVWVYTYRLFAVRVYTKLWYGEYIQNFDTGLRVTIDCLLQEYIQNFDTGLRVTIDYLLQEYIQNFDTGLRVTIDYNNCSIVDTNFLTAGNRRQLGNLLWWCNVRPHQIPGPKGHDRLLTCESLTNNW